MCAGWTFGGRQPRSTVPTEFRRGRDDQRPADGPPGRWGGVAKGAGQASKPDGVKYGRSPKSGSPPRVHVPEGWVSPKDREGQPRGALPGLAVLTRSALLGLVLTPEAKSCSFWRTSLGKLRLLRPSGQREAGGGFLDGDREEVVTDPLLLDAPLVPPCSPLTGHPAPRSVLCSLGLSPEQGRSRCCLGPHSTLPWGFQCHSLTSARDC